jgi:hypothetical protein
MSLNPTGRQQIAWSLIGGLNTELEPPTLPEGLSPDNQDIAFVPGEGGTRPGLVGTIASPFGAVGNLFETSFVLPTGDPINLYLTSDGMFRYQDVNNSPTDYTTLFTTLPNLYATSVTAFNRQYIAFSNGLIGQDIPRRINSDLTWQRFTQDGPAQSPTVADAATENITITTVTPLASVAIVSAINNAGVVTITTATPHGLVPGKQALITGNSVFSYNGQLVVETVPTSTTLTYDTVASGFPEGTGGELIPSQVTVKLSAPADYIIQGDNLVIENCSDANYNNSQSAVTTQSAGLASLPICTFYPYNDSNGGCFNYTFPGDGDNEPLPGPTGTFTLAANDSIFFNPNGPLAGPSNLPGAPSENNPPMIVFGVNKSGMWDGTQQAISSLTFDWVMTVIFNMSFTAAGSYTFNIGHKEGVMVGMGGGIVPSSGPMNNAQPHTVTAAKGYPLVYANNGSTEFFHVSFFNAQFTVTVPAPGTYPVEIDYCQWHHSNPSLFLLQATPTAAAWVSTTPYIIGNTVSVGGSNYICVLGNINQTPPNATYWALLPPFSPLFAGQSTFGTPSTWTIDSVINPSTFTFEAVYASGIGTGGTAQIGGLISPGTHQVCMSWLLDDDTITRPSPPVSWTAAGNKRVSLTNIATGPANVKGRVFNFTGTGGDNYFNLPLPATAPAFPPAEAVAQVSTSTFIMDNTSTSITFDFTDNSLFAGDAVDITGNDLFGQVTLGLPASVVSYSNRIGVIGNTNKIENMLGMGYEGGVLSSAPTLPLGWNTSGNINGELVDSPLGWGLAWQETGTGAAQMIGLLTQSAYEDGTDFSPILLTNQPYTYKVYLKASVAHMQGTVYADFYSPAHGGQLAVASTPASSVSTAGGFYEFNFSSNTPLTIPTDALFRTYGYAYGAGQQIIRDENMLVYTDEPVDPSTAIIWSYEDNAGAFHGVTGLFQTQYAEPARAGKILRDNFYVVLQNHIIRTKDNGIGEPVTWAEATVSDKTGGISVRCFDTGEGWLVFASNAGLYMCSGGEPQKVSQEIQTIWTAIDPNLYQHVWIKNDIANRHMYIGVPLTAYPPTGATFSPLSVNKTLMVDYHELNNSAAIINATPLHISMTGRMLSSDLTRKWSVWNIPANSAEILYLPSQNPQIVFGSGLGTGVENGFGQVYQLDPNQFFDDDYGQIGALNGESPLTYAQWLVSGPPGSNGVGTVPVDETWRPQAAYYVTYLAPSHEQEQQLQIGSQRKLFEYMEAYVTGMGSLYMLPLLNRIGQGTTRPPKPRMMSQYQEWDLEWPLNYKAQRMASLWYAQPVGVIPGIAILPATVTVSTHNTEQFAYTLAGTPTQNVMWSVQESDGGTVSDTGLYTAPGTAGTYHVVVTSVDSPSTFAVATVTVHGGYDGD